MGNLVKTTRGPKIRAQWHSSPVGGSNGVGGKEKEEKEEGPPKRK